jgi:1,4-dihydroxy-2-naphthoate octaprenyltransferase
MAALFAPFSGVGHAAGKAIWTASIVVSLLATVVLLQLRLRNAAWFAAPLALVAALRLVFDSTK